MGKKDDKIRALKEEIVQYQYDIEFLEERILILTNQLAEKQKKNKGLFLN